MGVLSTSSKLITGFFLAGNTLLLLFIILSGSIENTDIGRLYWLHADTSRIPGAGGTSRWTFWGLCSVLRGRNVNCSPMPAYPISPLDNFMTTDGIPAGFIENRDTYFHLSRFSFSGFLVAFAFLGIALFVYIFTFCSYAFSKVVFNLVVVGVLFNLAAVACQTAVNVMARNQFIDDGLEAELGTALLTIAWSSVLCCIFVFFGTGTPFINKAWNSHKKYVEMHNYKEQALKYQPRRSAALSPSIYNPEQLTYSNLARDLESGSGIDNNFSSTKPQNSELQRHRSSVQFFKVRKTKEKSDNDSI